MNVNMKTKIFALTAVSCLALGLTSCSEDLGPSGKELTGAAPTVDLSAFNFTATPQPGKILLQWTKPDSATASKFDYMRVTYLDPRTKQQMVYNVSEYESSIVIDKTRQRYGDTYNFTFTPYNLDSDEPGKAFTLEKAYSLAAPIDTVETNEAIQLAVTNFQTNAQQPTEGPLANICDGDNSTFFHTNWSNPEVAAKHWIDVDLGQELTRFKIETINRNQANNSPRDVTIYAISSLGDKNADMTTPLWSGTMENRGNSATNIIYVPNQDGEPLAQPVRFIRYVAEHNDGSGGSTKFWNLAEWKAYVYSRSIFNPETDEKEVE